MGWLISFLLAVLIVSVVALALPTLFGPLVAGVAPVLVVVAVIGLGGLWWRHRRHRIDPASEQPDAAATDADDGDEARGVDDPVET